ncbi:MAG: Lrp/AsnC family transcriptional regulator [Rhodovibrionaceae bacterium]|nr:Lrp/AsnC family transcriptional regulator [Rhodovibrionaceae bacterium]
MKLDRLDIKILSVLQREGRITKVRLADEIGLSPSPCMERVRRLENAGYICGYRAEIDLAKLSAVATVFVEVTLKSHEATDFERFERAMADCPWVSECYAIGGGIDYLLKVVARDITHYQALMDDFLEQDIGIGRYFTYVVTKPVKHDPGPGPEILTDSAK